MFFEQSPNIHSREGTAAVQEAWERRLRACSKGAWLGGHESSPAPSVRGVLLPRGSSEVGHTRQDTGAVCGERPGRGRDELIAGLLGPHIEELSAFPLSPLDISTQLSSPHITEHLSLEVLTLKWVRAGILVVSCGNFG